MLRYNVPKKAFLLAQSVKSLPAMQETQIQFLGQEDPLEKEWQPTPVFLPGESHRQRSLAGSLRDLTVYEFATIGQD